MNELDAQIDKLQELAPVEIFRSHKKQWHAAWGAPNERGDDEVCIVGLEHERPVQGIGDSPQTAVKALWEKVTFPGVVIDSSEHGAQRWDPNAGTWEEHEFQPSTERSLL